MVQQVPEPDLPPLAKTPWEEVVDRVVEPELRSATSCMATVATKLLVTLPIQNRSSGRACTWRRDVGLPRGDDGALAVLLDERDHGGELGRGDEPVGAALEL